MTRRVFGADLQVLARAGGEPSVCPRCRQLLAAVDAYLAQPDGNDEEAAVRRCFLAAFFEDIYRTGEIRRFSMFADATPTTGMDDLVAAVPNYVIDDIASQMKLADNSLASLRALPQPARVCGPVFHREPAIGGADTLQIYTHKTTGRDRAAAKQSLP